MIKNLLLFFFIFVINFAFSQDQEAIIFFNDGTSIEGFGSIKRNKIIFRITLEDKPDSWSFDMAKGITFIGFESKVKYQYVLSDEFSKPDPQLLEVLEEGNVTLYASVKRPTSNGGNVNSGLYSHLNLGLNLNSVFSDVVPYQSCYDDFNAKIELYVKRANEKFPTKLNGGFYQKTFNYFSDCDIITRKIKSGEYSKNKIIELVQYYNDYCTNQ